ncbi:MAG TPA: hypothetical protein VGL78_12625 [Solirubrobacteraceae bacterium]
MKAHRVGRKASAGLLIVVFGLFAMVVMCAPAMAEDATGWEVSSRSDPTNLAPGTTGQVDLAVQEIGARESYEGAILTDTLPVGVEGVAEGGWTCIGGSPDSCVMELPEFYPGRRAEYSLSVHVSAGTAEGAVQNVAAVSGGGASTGVTTSDTLQISSAPIKFGFAHARAWFSNAEGGFDTQAGTHPYAFTFDFDLNMEHGSPASGEIRNLTFNLPPGVIGNPTVVARCTREEFNEEICPAGSQVGVDDTGLGGGSLPISFALPVFNLVPPPGAPAEFGFVLAGNHVLLDASVRSDGDYGITEHVNNLPQRLIVMNSITIWGTPSDSSHDHLRKCGGTFGCPSSASYTPFLTVPTSCVGPVAFSAVANNWYDESITSEIGFDTINKKGQPQGFEGCGELDFAPTISAAPDTTAADTPAGLSVEVKASQEGLVDSEASEVKPKVSLAAANIKDTTVALPEGVVINPGQAAGLTACQSGEDGIGTQGPPSCPSSSQVGTDEIDTPLLAHPLKGSVYILQSNPPHLQLLVSAEGEGVYLKLVGDVSLNEQTGRLTTTFKETPELPFTSFKLSFSGGARAALATPTGCGEYTTTSDFTPWSAPFSSDVFPSSTFLITQGCASPLPFEPVLTAGSTTDQAGGYSSFSLLLTRADEQQRIASLSFRTPEGLLGMISKVPLCGEPQAAQGTCGAASQIGHTKVTAGRGPYQLVIPEPGQPAAPIYLTGPYKGAPYGLSIVVPAIAGPFNLGTIVVRASIAVDPHTAQLTVTTDPLPSILDGIPTDLRAINAVIDRPDFIFNPTSCAPQEFAGTATSTQGTVVPIASHFQMGSCRSLTFKPDFKVATSGKTSRADGASLDARIVYPTGVLGANQASSQANVQSVKVELPKQLPSRLTTLQKACTAAQFDSNPGGCPADSLVGSATAVTPVLPVPLTGPAYFVSRGGEAFPQLIVVLQGYGVTVDLVGDTFISKAGITSSTFKQVPDVPITSFELKLPEGPYSALAANLPEKAHGSFCGQSLTMPTQFVGQNGATLKQNTPITVEGCALTFRHKISHRTLTLSVYAPAAGKITAAGKGLTTQTKTAKGQEALTLTLEQKRAGKQKTTVEVTYTPTTAKNRKKQTKTAKLTFEK